MNKKEISEIRKQFQPEDCCITRMCGCYVDAEKNKKTTFSRTFLNLPDEEMFKYLEIFKKTLSGSIGRNLMNMDFPLQSEMEGGTQHFLLQLRDSELRDDALLDAFYDRVIANYAYAENYYIILIHAAYDVPGRTKDQFELEDASEEVYRFLLCSICPVNLSKAGLYYNAVNNSFEDRIRDWIVDMPDLGFLFPVFNDRSTDIHSILYYTKNVADLHSDFVDQLFGCVPPMTAAGQKDTFQSLIENTLGNECDLDAVKNIHGKLNEILDEQKGEPEPVVLQKEDVRRLLEESGVPERQLESFDQQFEIASGSENAPLQVSNLVNTRSVEIRSSNIQIRVKPDRIDLLDTKVIGGRHCLVIPMDEDVEFNGIRLRSAAGLLDPISGEIYEETEEEM